MNEQRLEAIRKATVDYGNRSAFSISKFLGLTAKSVTPDDVARKAASMTQKELSEAISDILNMALASPLLKDQVLAFKYVTAELEIKNPTSLEVWTFLDARVKGMNTDGVAISLKALKLCGWVTEILVDHLDGTFGIIAYVDTAQCNQIVQFKAVQNEQ